MDDDGCGLKWIARLGAVIVALKAGYRAYGGIVFRTTVANRCRRAREVGAEAAWLNDRNLDPKRADLLREYFRKPFDASLSGGIGVRPMSPMPAD